MLCARGGATNTGMKQAGAAGHSREIVMLTAIASTLQMDAWELLCFRCRANSAERERPTEELAS
jgi:hypothetical protein